MRLDDLMHVMDHPKTVPIAEYIGTHGLVPSTKIREVFLSGMTDSFFKSILQCLNHGGVIKAGKFVREAGKTPCREYEACKDWRKKLIVLIEARIKWHQTKRETKTKRERKVYDYPTGDWVQKWKPFRDPMHTLLMGK